MLYKTLAVLSLCSLPMLADSIQFSGYATWTDLGNATATGTDNLNYSKTGYSQGIPVVTVSTQNQIKKTGNVYHLAGSLTAEQGLPPFAGQPSSGEAGANLSVTLTLSTASGNFLVSGVTSETNNDGYGTGFRSCQVLVRGGSDTSGCRTPTFAFTIEHTPGTPISLSFSFGNYVQSFESTYTESFEASVTDPADASVPEPGSFWLWLSAGVLFGACRWVGSLRRTAAASLQGR